MSIIDRLAHKTSPNEKKRESAGGESVATEDPLGQEDGSDDGTDNGEREGEPRKVYFNIPLPPNALDENGRPAVKFNRNKIRTAKYTPISFVPKNLWFQFHNIANMYFLFMIILSVSVKPLPCLCA